ncbi:MAG: YggS family pyridoxal phosphate-dependent enzyme [Flavobacteriales bacterium]|nr:YggS family pyridoxal phosphate-dependent enzyme [Flavobacteriales bacterium]
MDREALAERYAQVNASLPARVKLIAVSKTRAVEEIKALYELGHRDFGENYPQELREKQPLLPTDIRWHFIGHLQTNKAKYIAPFVHLVHTVDGPRILDELNKRAGASGRTIDVLAQVHIAREETKHGMAADEVRSLLLGWEAMRWPSIRVRGLMGMASNTDDTTQAAREFEGLKALFDGLREKGPFDPRDFSELSMGMSSDAPAAIAAGSTMVRIGTAIFGPRA